MRRWRRWITTIAAATMLAGCGTGQDQNRTETVTEAAVRENSEMTETEIEEESVSAAEVETVRVDLVEAAAGADEEKILIAYFTWADNTHVEDPSAVDLDATTSASVLPPGNAALLAGFRRKWEGIYFPSRWKNLIPAIMTNAWTGRRMRRRITQGRR